LKAPIAVTLAALTLAVTPARAIVGDSADDAAHADETVMVLSRDPKGSGFCTGIVLTPRIILTAAHCLRAPSDMLVHFRDPGGAPVVVEVAAKLVHPDYRPDAAQRRVRSIDVGLLETKTALPSRFRPPKLGEGEPPPPGDAVIVVGYGITQEGEPKTGGALRAGQLRVREPRSEVLLWAAPENDDGGAYSGDSGGPIYAADDKTVVAAVAWTEGRLGHKCGALTQGVLLAPLRAWIETAISRWQD